MVTNLDSDLVKIFLKLKRPGREELVKYTAFVERISGDRSKSNGHVSSTMIIYNV